MPRHIRAILFDLDDTILTWQHAKEGWELFKRSRTAGVHAHMVATGRTMPDLDAFHSLIEATFLGLWDEARIDHRAAKLDEGLLRALEEAGVDRSSVDVDALLRAYGWGPIPSVVPFPDAEYVLRTLEARGFWLGLVTNAMQPMWMRDMELAWHGLLDRFPVRVSSFDAGYMKPHPQIYRMALEGLGASPEEAVFVGDRPANDIAGANALGMLSVLMQPRATNARAGALVLPEDQQPDHTIRSLTELLAIV